MKFSVKKEKILEELQLLQGIVEKRSTMPILANILLKVTGGTVEMTGTDLEVGLKTKCEAEVEEEGSITVSGKKVFEIVKSLQEESLVSFEEKDDLIMEITSGESEFKVMCLPKDDYPVVPEPKFEKNIILDLGDFKEMIDRVYHTITQEQRYYLNGALMILKEKSLELVSTDGHRLSYTSKNMEDLNIGEEIKVIVAKKTLSELKKIDDGTMEFDLDENNLFYRVKNRILISRIIESKFPNYEAVIPKDNPHILILPSREFTDSIRRVSLLSTERSKGIKFYLEKNQLRLFSSNPEIGEARDRIEVEYNGQDLEIGFNSQYILDFMGTVKSDKVRLELKDENSAALMRPEAQDEIQNIYVLMPMKI